MRIDELHLAIAKGELDQKIAQIIGNDDVTRERERYFALIDQALEAFGDGDYHFISSPGRAEIGGNHTDHQHGHVLAAGLNVDNLAIVKRRDDLKAIFLDPHFPRIEIDLHDLLIREEEKNSSESLIRGIASKLKDMGYLVGGFEAICDSRVLIGSGISSSACFEVLIAEIFNKLFNEEKINAIERALVSQYAENVYFGKPSGLLDQLAISIGGFTAVDFKDPSKPVIENFNFSFSDHGYELLIINTKGSHSDLSHEYAAIPNEIKEVAKELGVEYLADSSLDVLLENLSAIREQVGNDRAILRSLHFYNEDVRAIKEKEAVKNNDVEELLRLMKESGHSSYMYLQNVYAASAYKSQSLAMALCLCDLLLKDRGSYRIQGGGFEGTIQAVVPHDMLESFKESIAAVFGENAIITAKIRPFGTAAIV